MPDSPAGPPTPPIPLTELLAREELGLRRIAGPADAELLWVHTSEMADPYPYLLGGELLLSAGVQLGDADAYVARLVEARAAALGFGLRPVYDTVPEALVEACDRHGLPLVEVAPETPFTTIARAVWRLMAEARHRELRRVTRAQQALAAAAARPDPVPAVLHQLATRLEGRAVLLAADGDQLHAAGRPATPEATEALTRLARVVSAPAARGPRPVPEPEDPLARAAPAPRPAPASATDTLGDTHLSAYALGGGQGLVLALAARRRDAGDHTVAGIAVVLLSLLAAPHQGADAAGRSAALVRLLLGAEPQEVEQLLNAGTGPGSDGWTVVHARRTDGSTADPFTAGALGAALGSALVDGGRDTVRVLLTGSGRIVPQQGWTLGASAPTSVATLAAAETEAARALARATATRTPLAAHHPAAGLAALIPPVEAEAHAHTLLAPLGAPLRDTLRCWLSLHGNWDRTAVALSVHRNTVRQRIGRCATLLGTDLDDMDVRAELWWALRYGATGSA